MDVCMICSGLGHVIRGVERFFLNLASELVRREGVKVTLYGGGNLRNNLLGYVKVPTIKRSLFRKIIDIQLPIPVSLADNIELSIFAVTLTPKLLGKNCDILLNGTIQNILPIRVYQKLREKGGKHIFVNHGGFGIAHLNFNFCDHLVAINPLHKTLFEGRLKGKIPVSLIPVGVDTDKFRRVNVTKEEMNLPDKFIIFSSSALVKQKRIDVLIEAASMIEDAYLVIASTGPEMDYLKRLGEKLMGGNIRFLGGISDQDLIRYYSVADVFCLPSIIEPSPTVLLEAMSCETPVVTNNSYPQRWAVNGGGSCVDVRNPKVLSEALERYRDRKLAREVGKLGRENVEHRFSLKVVAERYYNLFKEVMK